MAGVGAIRSARESQPRLEPEHGVQPRDAHALPVPAVGDTTFSLLSDLLGSTAGQRYCGRGHDDPARSISTPRNLPFGGCLCDRSDGMFVAEGQPRIGVEVMTDKTGLTDLTRDYATGDWPHAHRVPERRRWTAVMMHRCAWWASGRPDSPRRFRERSSPRSTASSETR